MAENSDIEWTDHTHNWWWGCEKVSPACKNCYAQTMSERWKRAYWGKETPRWFPSGDNKKNPKKWNDKAKKTGIRQRVFTNSMSDFFEDNDQLIQARKEAWDIIRECKNLDWLILTKRADAIEKFLPADWQENFGHCWLGVTVESKDYIYRADILRQIPAANRFISYEPALGPIHDELDLTGFQWVIFGGERAPKFRAHDDDWARKLMARCEGEGVSFFFKQGSGRIKLPRTLDGQTIHQLPKFALPVL